MNGAETTKGLIFTDFNRRLANIEDTGCSTGKVHTQELKDGMRRVGNLESQFWAVIMLLISNLTATILILIRK